MGGLGKYVTCHSSEFLFLFLLSSSRAQVAFLTVRDDLCTKTRVSGQGCAFWGSRQYPTTFWRSTPKIPSPKLVGIVISQPNRQSRKKPCIYRSPMKIFASNFIDRLNTWALSKNAKLGQRGSKMGHVTYF